MFRSYLLPPDPRLFELDRGETAWVWRQDDVTALFDEQLALVVEQLERQLPGLPPLVTIMCLATVQRKWEGEECWRRRLRLLPAKGQRAAGFEEVVTFLKLISRLPARLRQGVDNTVAILTYGLEGKRDWLFEASRREAGPLRDYLLLHPDERPELSAVPSQVRRDNTRCRRAWTCLVELARSLKSDEQLGRWIRTGLSGSPQPAEIATEPLAKSATPMLDAVKSLEQVSAYRRVARLSQLAGSMLSLPRRPTDSDELPMGGVSDITNRGTPERLLMAELAADPMVLLARIANGQALYLRREVPPAPQPSHRSVLIESSIRSWGSRRVYLAALALGIGLSAENQHSGRLSFHLVAGEHVEEYELTDKDRLLEFLGRLDVARDPSAGLKQYFENKTQADEDDESAPVLVLTSATAGDSKVKAVLRDLPKPLVLVQVDENGNAEVSHLNAHGNEVVQHLTLDLPAENQASSQRSVQPADLPQFVGLSPSPLLFAPPGQYRHFHIDPEQRHVWVVTPDRRLLRFTQAKCGGQQISDALPSANPLCMDTFDGNFRGVFEAGGKTIWFEGSQDGAPPEVRQLDLPFRPTSWFIVHRYLLAFGPDRRAVIDPRTGKVIEEQSKGWRHLGLNYMVDAFGRLWMHGGATPGDWHVVGNLDGDGSEAACVVTSGAGVACAIQHNMQLMEIRDREEDRSISTMLYPASNVSLPQGAKFSALASSPDRYTWLIGVDLSKYMKGEDGIIRVNLQSGHVRELRTRRPTTLLSELDSQLGTYLKPLSIRSRIKAVRLTSEGFVLRSSRRRYLLLKLADQAPRRLVLQAITPDRGEEALFGDHRTAPGPPGSGNAGWTLRRADLPGGTCWLDSRGLMHVRRDGDPRELTLVLIDSHVSGWFSSTGYFGTPYFGTSQSEQESDIGGNLQPTPVPEEVLEWLSEWK